MLKHADFFKCYQSKNLPSSQCLKTMDFLADYLYNYIVERRTAIFYKQDCRFYRLINYEKTFHGCQLENESYIGKS